LKLERAAGKLFRKSSFARFRFTQKRQRSSLNNYTNFVKDVTSSNIRQFLLIKYLEPIEALGLTPANLPDDFDFLLNGVIDSFGILEMISAIEEEFQIELDLAALDAEQITILGPLSRYVAERGISPLNVSIIQTKQ
jgi:acyl carrier protein